MNQFETELFPWIDIPEEIAPILWRQAKMRNMTIPEHARNYGCSGNKESTRQHFEGLLGEYGFSVISKLPIDWAIYNGRGDKGADFGSIEVKTVVAYGGPLPEFKMKLAKLNEKKKTARAIVLCRAPKDYSRVQVLAGMSMKRFLECGFRKNHRALVGKTPNWVNHTAEFDLRLSSEERREKGQMTALTPDNIDRFVELYYHPKEIII